MAEPGKPVPVLLVVAAFGRRVELLERARAELERQFGPVARSSALFDFDQTSYYEPTMGGGLRKQLWAFADLIAAERLAEIKHRTNAIEREIATEAGEGRPVNLDPGYLVLGKFLLATTKDQAHRVYLRDGIFAEVTLQFRDGEFRPWPWTYADYRTEEVLRFLGEAREFYKRRLTGAAAG